MNGAKPSLNVFHKAYSPLRRPFNQKLAGKTNNFNEKVYTAKFNNVTTTGPEVVVSTIAGKRENAGNPQYALHDQGIFDSGCSRHMTRNKSYLTDYQDIDGGFVAFAGSPKGGKITRKSVFFIETECLVLSPNFKLLDESQVLLKVPRQNNMYSFDLKNVVPSGGETLLEAYLQSILKMTILVLLVRRESNTNPLVFFLATKDETSRILKTFITGIENQINHKVKIIRCDNGTEFKNNDMNQLCGMKGIKREFSVARTPQQNKVVERKNRILIEAARTMLADLLLPTIFWAEAVNTACYCSEWVLNPLGKFDRKDDKGFLVGYSISSKAFRVFNSRTRKSTDDKDADEVPDKGDDDVSQRNGQEKEGGASNKEDDQHVQDFRAELDSLLVQQKEGYANSTNRDSTASPSVSTARPSINTASENINTGSPNINTASPIPNDSSMQSLENTGIFDDAYDDREVGAEADLNNLETTMNVSPIPITRIHKDHPKDQIIGDINSATQTRKMTKISEEHIIVWTLVDLPKGKRAIGTKWVYRNKEEEEVYVCQPLGFEDPQFPNKVYKVQQKEDGIFISQDKYVADILKTFYFVTVKIASTPMEPNKALVKDKEVDNKDVHLYKSMIGSLMYLTASRPDITFAVCACARFQVTPKVSHLHAVKRIFRYLKGQPKLGLWYPRDSPFDLEAFSDSDYAGASLDRKSTQKVVNFLAKGSISWHVKSRLCCNFYYLDAEYIDAANCCGQDRQSSMVGFGKMRQLEVLRYALTKNLTIYVSLIEKFWKTTIVKTVDNVEQEINAIVDGKEFTIIKASVRRHLQLADADGISVLPNTKIFDQLTLMGYVLTDDKLTFQKEPISNIESSSPQKTQSPRQALNKDTELPQTSVPIPNIPDEVVHQERGNSMEMADTTATSLEAMHDNSNIAKTQSTSTPTEPISQETGSDGGNTPRSDEDSMTLQELTGLYTKLSDMVLALEIDLRQTKKVYVSDDDIASEASSKQGRMIEEIDQDVGVTLVTPTKVSSQKDQPEDQLGVLSAAKVLADAARVPTYSRRRRAVSTGSSRVNTASRRRRAVSTGSGRVSTASRIVNTAGMIQQVNIIIPSLSATKDKGKAIMTESEPEQTTTKLKQRQERAGYEAAIRLQEQLDQEES
ncbi:putative ribonuclease H-like domain-containing protein [Tanacetum coccineum]